MNINIIGEKVEPPYFRKPKSGPVEDTAKFVIFIIGIVVGCIATILFTSGGMH